MENTKGGLRLQSKAGMTDQEKEDLQASWNTIDTQERVLEKKYGFPRELDRPPFDRPTLTAEQLTATSNQDYTTLYAQHLAWFNYTSPLLAKTKARLIQKKNELLDIERTTRKRLREANRLLPKDERLNEKDIEDEIWSDPRYKELIREEQRQTQTRIELESYLEIMENNLRVISRQVELRKIEMEGAHRENAMPFRGNSAVQNRFPPLRNG